MKLYIKQKLISWKDKFKVFDANGEEKFYAEGDSTFPGKRLHLYDMKGNEVVVIEERRSDLIARYFVWMNGKVVTEVVDKFSLFKQKYFAEGLGWEITGDFFAHKFRATKNDRCIVALNKQWMSWGDCYEIDIENESDETLALAIVIVIDCILESREVGGS